MPKEQKSQKKSATKKATDVKRTRKFATIVYPESAPKDWVEMLNECHVPALISPLHDKDINPSGEQKKPHYHVLLMFDSPREFEKDVKPIFDKIGGVGREHVLSSRGYTRYLCHLDNPEKAQYEPSDVKQLGGANYILMTQLPTDDINQLGEVFAFIQKNKIYSLAELLDICKDSHPEWFSMIAMSRCYIVDKFIKSLEWERSTGYIRAVDRPKVDKDTGEVIDE